MCLPWKSANMLVSQKVKDDQYQLVIIFIARFQPFSEYVIIVIRCSIPFHILTLFDLVSQNNLIFMQFHIILKTTPWETTSKLGCNLKEVILNVGNNFQSNENRH